MSECMATGVYESLPQSDVRDVQENSSASYGILCGVLHIETWCDITTFVMQSDSTDGRKGDVYMIFLLQVLCIRYAELASFV